MDFFLNHRRDTGHSSSPQRQRSRLEMHSHLSHTVDSIQLARDNHFHMASVDAASLAARNDAAMTTPIPRRCVISTGSIGSVVEHYDFGVYGYGSPSMRYFFFLVASREPAGPYYRWFYAVLTCPAIASWIGRLASCA
jgi:hypothetical protein